MLKSTSAWKKYTTAGAAVLTYMNYAFSWPTPSWWGQLASYLEQRQFDIFAGCQIVFYKPVHILHWGLYPHFLIWKTASPELHRKSKNNFYALQRQRHMRGVRLSRPEIFAAAVLETKHICEICSFWTKLKTTKIICFTLYCTLKLTMTIVLHPMKNWPNYTLSP